MAHGTGREDDGAEARAQVVVALGSNMGDRLANLRSGLSALTDAVAVEAVSSVYESKAADYLEQPDFLNAVVRGVTRLTPGGLLAVLMSAEAEAGRRRTVPRGPRQLDLDLIFYGDRVIRSDTLTVPHPRWSGRAFVCVPLLEVASELTDPSTGQPVREICAGVTDPGLTRYAGPSELEEVL